MALAVAGRVENDLTPMEDRARLWFRMDYKLGARRATGSTVRECYEKLGTFGVSLLPVYDVEYDGPDQMRYVASEDQRRLVIVENGHVKKGPIVSKYYKPVQPVDIVTACDQFGLKPDVMLRPKDDHRLIVGFNLGTMSVRGDVIHNNGVLDTGGCDVGNAVRMWTVPEPERCTNVLGVGSEGTTGVALLHRGEMGVDMVREWLIETFRKFPTHELPLIQRQLDAMAYTPISEAKFIEIAEKVFPDPKNTRKTSKRPDQIDFAMRYQAKVDEVREQRRRALSIFKGNAAGMRALPDVLHGTAYAGLQAFTELLTWGGDRTTMDLIIGNCVNLQRKVWDELYKISIPALDRSTKIYLN